MKKLLNTFFFGYASYKYRRLIRTPIILIAVGSFIGLVMAGDEEFLWALLFFPAGFCLISYLVEPFVVKTDGGESINSNLTNEQEKLTSIKKPIGKHSSHSAGATEFIASEKQPTVINSDLLIGRVIPILGKLFKDNPYIKKAIRILLRVIVFIGVYIPLFTIPFYSGASYLTPVIVLIAFFLSRPLATAIISKWLPSLNS